MRGGNLSEWDRRRLATGIGVAVLAVQCLPAFAQTSGSPSEKSPAAENLLIHSSPGFGGHTHNLLIPYSVLDEPPLQGIRLESTTSLFHTHSVALTREQLVKVRHGEVVAVKASSHTFSIALTDPRSPHEHRVSG